MSNGVDSGRLKLDRFLPYQLSILSSKVKSSLAREYEQALGLQLPEARVLTVLGFYRPVSSNAIVQHTSMDKATVSRAVTRLLRLGLLTRRPDPRDRRLLVLDFSPRGDKAYATLARSAMAWEDWFVGGLPRPERDRLRRLLLQLNRRLDTLAPPGAGRNAAAASERARRTTRPG